MSAYTAYTTYGDFGPWISKLVVELPDEVHDVTPESFSVYCERCGGDGNVATVVERPSMRTHASRGYVPVLAASTCNEMGESMEYGRYVTLTLPECELTSRINVASVAAAEYVECRFVVTQTRAFAGARGTVCGLVANVCTEVLSPSLAGWSHGRGGVGEYEFGYACFDPHAGEDVAEKSEALIVWLHGASDGGNDVRLPYTASHVTLLGEPRVQKSFPGGAWVMVPQCPTFWMDDGVEQMGRSNISIYTESLKSLIDEFVAAHPSIDPARIVVGGLSNGGFMAVRLIADYPEAFAACVGSCAPFFEENQTPEVVEAISKTPLWLAHSKDDFIVDAKATVLPLIHKLEAVGAEAHLSYYDHVEDETGLYKDAAGNPRRNFGHGVWIHVFNDFCHTELDGTNVMCDGEPVRIWEWAGRMSS